MKTGMAWLDAGMRCSTSQQRTGVGTDAPIRLTGSPRSGPGLGKSCQCAINTGNVMDCKTTREVPPSNHSRARLWL